MELERLFLQKKFRIQQSPPAPGINTHNPFKSHQSLHESETDSLMWFRGMHDLL